MFQSPERAIHGARPRGQHGRQRPSIRRPSESERFYLQLRLPWDAAVKSFVVSGVPKGVYCRGISQPAVQYALYHHHSQLEERNHYYIVTPGNYRETLVLDLHEGTYKVDWIDPASSSVLNTATFTHQGGNEH